MAQIKRDLITYISLLIISFLMLFWIIPIQVKVRSTWSVDAYCTSRTFPNMLMVALGVVSVVGIVSTIMKYKQLSGEQRQEENKNTHKQVLFPFLIYVLCAVYAVAFIKIGFIAATFIMTPILLWFLGCRNWRYYLVVYVFAALIFIIFKLVLRVPLP